MSEVQWNRLTAAELGALAALAWEHTGVVVTPSVPT